MADIIFEGIFAQERTRGTIGPHAQQRNIFPFSSTSTNTNIPSTSVALIYFFKIIQICLRYCVFILWTSFTFLSDVIRDDHSAKLLLPPPHMLRYPSWTTHFFWLSFQDHLLHIN